MLYRFENCQLKFKNITTSKEYLYDIPKVSGVDFVTINKCGTHIAFTAYDNDGESKGIFLCDLPNERLQKIYDKQAFDLMFDIFQKRLFFNSGNTINYIDLQTGKSTKLYKFSRITYAPISLCQNDKGTYLSYHKWKSNRRRLYIYDLMENTENDMGISFYEYNWIDEHRIIYSLCNGLVILNVNTKKSERIISNTESLIKNYVDNNDKYNVLNKFKGIDLVVDNIDKPIFFNKRIYFEVFIASDEDKHIGIYSISNNKTDLQCHFASNQGLIRNYGILSDGETIYISITPNNLQKETINSGIIYLKNNLQIENNGWFPVNTYTKPTVYEIIQGT
ncbi:hypothetical protein EHE19_013405 [Ruminiclostridium herbifermentans]|uniref:Uncharacterized protein n=1 Tax=Ruminiclostridium herbifermentans TaxID=2488810 RepID=A0A4U7JBQ3_9FIRM|nr:hypothetical protein [Ruminiclostridium herbifermentans]QNU65884.1 hypothetical protein EHE19_013405 [Ruminiclostridium herbifermentans]